MTAELLDSKPLRRLQAVGYWFNDLAPSGYPRPQALIGRWRKATRARVIAYLRAGALFESYGAPSFCRFACGATGKTMGHRDLFDGTWVWPEGLAHYVEAHDVRLPARFVRHVMTRPLRKETIKRPTHREGLIDDSQWIEWGRERGAAIRFAPAWQIPNWQTQRTIEQQIQQRLSPKHVLWQQPLLVLLARADTRDVVLMLPTAQLALVRLSPRTRTLPTTIIAGWHEWPR